MSAEDTNRLLVYKSHNLNEMILNTDIQPIEYKLILIGISLMDPRPGAGDLRELSVKLPLESFARIMGYKYGTEAEKNTVKSNLSRDSKNILDISVRKEKKNGGFAEGNIITWFEFNNDDRRNPYIQLWYNEQLRDDITNLTGSYVAYRLSNVIHLKKTAHIRLYDLCRQWLVAGHWDNVPVEKLRAMISRKGGSYKKWYDFKRNVLDPSVEAVNKNTDIFVSYTTVNLPHEKTVGYVSFKIKSNGSFRPALTEPGRGSRAHASRESYRDTGLSYQQLVSFIPEASRNLYMLLSLNDTEKYDERIKNYIDSKIDLYQAQIKRGVDIRNPEAWINRALSEDYYDSEPEEASVTAEKTGAADSEQESTAETFLGKWGE